MRVANPLSEDGANGRHGCGGGTEQRERSEHRKEIVEAKCPAVAPGKAASKEERRHEPPGLLSREAALPSSEVDEGRREDDHPRKETNSEAVMKESVGETAQHDGIEEEAARDRATLRLARPAATDAAVELITLTPGKVARGKTTH